MKRTFHIAILFATLLWVSFPQLVSGSFPHQNNFCFKQQSEIGVHSVMLNLPVKTDTRIELTGASFLPEIADKGFRVHKQYEQFPLDLPTFIVSGQMYTQITSSYL